jgi:ATP-dependent Clp protease ATP-binding subunit ClpA
MLVSNVRRLRLSFGLCRYSNLSKPVKDLHQIIFLEMGNPMDALKQFGTDLTELARAGKLDPVIGREEEIRRTLQM